VVEVPAVVRSKATVVGAGRWLAGLDALVADVAERWGLALGRTYPDATEALVIAVELGDGTPAVLKVLLPRGDGVVEHELEVLRLAGGDGCVRLLDADEDRGALLLERLGPSLHDVGLPYGERLDVLVEVARRVWRPAPDLRLPTGAEKARWLAEHIAGTWEALDRPCPEAVVDHALACAESRREAHDPERAVLVHGDVHQWNTCRRGDGWALIDPDGLLAEPEYDLGVLLREDPGALLAAGPWAVAVRLAERCGLDPVATWEWGVVERVSTGLLCQRIGLLDEGRAMLDAAAVLAGPGPWPAPGRRSARPPAIEDVSIRSAGADDQAFLEQMLAVAADWRADTAVRTVAEVLADPAVGHYLDGWPRPGDAGVVAVDATGTPLGAAWYRTFATDDPGYGWVADDVPEVAIGVAAAERGRGIGRRLLEGLAETAAAEGIERLSLSVEVDNPAMRLYLDLGWIVVAEADGAATMVLDLSTRSPARC